MPRFIRAVLLILAIAPNCAPPAPPTQIGAELVPGVRLQAGDRIEAIAVAAGADGRAHLLWSEAFSTSGNNESSTRLRYCRRDRASVWSEPISLPEGALGQVRLLSDGNALHAIVGPRLRHLASLNQGASWAELASLGSPHIGATALDVIAAGNYIGLVYALPIDRPARHLDIWYRRLSRDGSLQPTRVASITINDFSKVRLHLLESGDSLCLVYSADEHSDVTGPDPERGKAEGRIFVTHSRDQGVTWSSSVGIDTHTDQAEPPGNLAVRAIAPLFLGSRLLVFYLTNSIHVIQPSGGGAWTRPVTVCEAPSGAQRPRAVAKDLRAIATGSEGRLLWIDSRYARVEGIPFSPLATTWPSNDVLTIPMSGFMSGEWLKDVPSRLTHDLSLALALQACSAGRRGYVLRSGVEQVTRSEASSKAPRLFFADLPLE